MAELRAISFLRRRGYRVIHIRWRGGGGEIDLIAKDGITTVFIEVKSAPRLGQGAQRVDKSKAMHLHDAANAYLAQHQTDQYRYEILEDSDAGFRLIRNGF